MLSIKALDGGGGAIHSYLSQSDYYSENEKVTGYWFGQSAKELGLWGAVNLKDFESIFRV